MAGIDKIYGTYKQYIQFKDWLKDHKPEALDWIYEWEAPPKGTVWSDDHPISNFPEHIDRWLLKNCPIDWVLERIKEQYGIKMGKD